MPIRDPSRHFEHPDPKPMALPSGFTRPLTLAEQVARLVKSHQFNQAVQNAGMETFEEADDFDIEDDPVDPSTPYEPAFDPLLGKEVTPADILSRRHEIEHHTAVAVQARQETAKPSPATPLAAPPENPPPAKD